MSEYVYACTWVEKTVQNWGDEGADPYSTRTIFCDRCHVTGTSFGELLEKLRQHFGLDLDDLFIPDDDEITGFGYNQIEDAHGNEDEDGKYLADYHFVVEKRSEPLPLTRADLEGITTH